MIALWKIAWTEGIGEIWTHWVRTLLTMIGIIMSVSALVGMVALNEGLARGKRESSNQTGNLTKIIVRSNQSRAATSERGLFGRGLVVEDIQALKSGMTSLEWISPILNYGREKVTYGNRIVASRVVAGLPEVATMDRYLPPVAGRFITATDVALAARTCVLGGSVVKQLFERPADALGKRIVIRGVSFTVVGVTPEHLSEQMLRKIASGEIERQTKRKLEQRRGAQGGYDPYSWKNMVVVVPLSTAFATFNSANVGADGIDLGPLINLSEIQIGFHSNVKKTVAIEQARRVLLQAHHGVEDFEIQPPDAGMEEVEQEIRSSRITGGVIAGISLLVGGLGIVNIMLASIADRTREIGVRRALGASAADVFRQVLVEATSIAVIGGFLGIGGTLLLLRGLEAVSPPSNAPILSWGMVVFGICSAGAIGIAAGVYPAWKASALSPTEALTSE